jgi:hypothetical protein
MISNKRKINKQNCDRPFEDSSDIFLEIPLRDFLLFEIICQCCGRIRKSVVHYWTWKIIFLKLNKEIITSKKGWLTTYFQIRPLVHGQIVTTSGSPSVHTVSKLQPTRGLQDWPLHLQWIAGGFSAPTGYAHRANALCIYLFMHSHALYAPITLILLFVTSTRIEDIFGPISRHSLRGVTAHQKRTCEHACGPCHYLDLQATIQLIPLRDTPST